MNPTPSDSPSLGNDFRMRGSEMTRLETFTDAAFAFALTLLVISLEPTTDLAELKRVLREIPAFLLSAGQLMMFWWGHHVWSRRYGLDDGPTVLLSCLLVFSVLIYVVPLRFMFGVLMGWIGYVLGLPIGPRDIGLQGPEQVNTVLMIYGVGFFSMSSAIVLLYLHAWRKRRDLELSRVEVHDTVAEGAVWATVAAAGALSSIVAVVVPATWVGAPGWVYMTLPIATPYLGLRFDRRRVGLIESDDPTAGVGGANAG